MNKVGMRDYMIRVGAWQRVPKPLRKMVETRDDRARPCKELWAYGKCYTRIVSLGGGLCELYADRGGMRVPEQGKIAFTTWDEPERVFGNGKPHGMPMVPRRL